MEGVGGGESVMHDVPVAMVVLDVEAGDPQGGGQRDGAAELLGRRPLTDRIEDRLDDRLWLTFYDPPSKIARGMPLEMADRDTLVALVTLADSSSDVSALTDALSSVIAQRRGEPRAVPAAASWVVEPDPVLTPREAFFSPAESVAVEAAVGRVSAELVASYPPGVPVLAPGERVTAEAVGALLDAQREGIRIAYAADPSLATFQVVRE